MCTDLVDEIIEKFEKFFGDRGQCADLHKIGKLVAKKNGMNYCEACEDTIKEAMIQKNSDYYDFK